ncbi:MAG: hypothetical protein J6O51_02760 [Bacteroidales bacterium]|nr:hypothetical protein [Bacteroidales bacterium]
MRKSFIFAAILCAAVISCTKEVAPEEKVIESHEGYVPVTLSAQCDVETKAVLNGKKIVWAVGEEVAVFTSASENPLKFSVVEATETGNVKIAGEAPADATSFIAAYPYEYAESCKDGVVNMYMPASQTIPEDGNVDPKALESVAYFTDATAKGVFKNIFSLLSFELGQEGIYNVEITPLGDSGQIGAGNVYVSVSATEDPVIADATPFVAVTSQGGKYAPFATETTYYIAVAPGAIDGLKVRMFSGDKYMDRSTEASSVLARNKGFNFKVLTDGCAWKYFTITNAEELQAFLAEAATYNEDDLVQLGNDIDMSGVTLESSPAYKGVFDGKGYSLKNWKTAVPLFGTVHGKVNNLTIDSSCEFTDAAPGNNGFIAKALRGTMNNCHNNADISLTLSGDSVTEAGEAAAGGIESRRIGALVGRMTAHNAQMTNCSNSGDVTVNVNISQEMPGTLYVGGLVGLVGDPGEDVVTRLDACTNTGDVTVNTTSTDPTQAWLGTHYIGGVAGATGVNKGSSTETSGYTLYYGEIRNCVNEGKVQATWGGGTGGYFKVGGVLGYSEAALFDCVNKGAVSFINSDTISNAGPSVGGIAGALAGKATVNAKDCVNEGSVSLSGMFSNAGSAYASGQVGFLWATAGGCFGTVGDNATLVDNCDNKGEVTVDAKMPATAGSSSAFGGVIGANMAQVKGCDNLASKTTNLSGMTANCHLGGAVGYTYAPVSDCVVSAPLKMAFDVTSLTTNQKKTYNNIGGVVGYANTGADITNCELTSAASLNATSNGELRFGGIVGMSYVTVSGCSNNADMTVSRTPKISGVPYTSYVGGIAGLQNADFAVEGCTNGGDLSVTMDPDSKYSYVAGIVAYTKGSSIKSCSNSGDITVDGGQMVKQLCVCGINGWNNVATSFEDLSNSGDITVSNWNNSAYNYIGGITGNYNKGGNRYKNLSNSGNITSTTPCKMRLGGIGAAINASGSVVENVTNTGTISVTSGLAASQIGGIAGYWGAGDLKQAASSGAVKAESTSDSFVGGLIGALNVDSAWTDIESTGSAEATAGDSYAGYLLGEFSAKGKKISLSKPYSFTATVNGEAPTDDNAVGFWNEGVIEKIVPFTEDLAGKKFTYDGKEYPIVQLADGKWWMAAPMAYVPEGKTVSSDPVEDAGIWYTYTISNKVGTANTSFTDGYLYDAATAFGLSSYEDITYGTQDNIEEGNYRSFEGTQGICPPGWYIPTRADFLKLVGASNKDDSTGETAPVDDPTAVYYDSTLDGGGSNIGIFNNAGWNFSFLGTRNKTALTQTGAYGASASIDETKCDETAWYGKPALNQIWSSTPYKPNKTGSSVQYFCLMSTFTAKYKTGRLSLSYGQYLCGMEVRCVRKAD